MSCIAVGPPPSGTVWPTASRPSKSVTICNLLSIRPKRAGVRLSQSSPKPCCPHSACVARLIGAVVLYQSVRGKYLSICCVICSSLGSSFEFINLSK